MHIKRKFLLITGDILFILFSSYIAGYVRFGELTNVVIRYPIATGITILIYVLCFYIFEFYNIEKPFKFRYDIFKMALAVCIAGLFAISLFYAFSRQYGRGLFLLQLISVWFLVSIWHRFYSIIFQKILLKKKTLIIGAGHCGLAAYQLLDGPLSPYEIVGFLDDDPVKQGSNIGSTTVIGLTDQLLEKANLLGVSEVVLAITHNRPLKLFRYTLDAKLKGITVIEMPTLFEQMFARIPVEHIQERWLLLEEGFQSLNSNYANKIKRLIDIALSLLIIVATFPLAFFTALVIRVDSPGPVFYKQARMGKGGVIFNIIKFRSMYQDAEKCDATWAMCNDLRITRVGKCIRLLRIDELPQLWNVMVGEMSLIGPRPERPEFIKDIEIKVPYYYIRHLVKPGISGWAQVNYPYGASIEDTLHKLEYDIYYVKNMSLFLDLMIFIKTTGVVLMGKGAR